MTNRYPPAGGRCENYLSRVGKLCCAVLQLATFMSPGLVGWNKWRTFAVNRARPIKLISAQEAME